jgi:hypothetical protein
LETAFGAEEASILMDRPPGGWNDLVTNQVLEARLAALENKMVAELAKVSATMERGFRAQTWRLMGATFVAFGVFAGLVRV